MSYETFLKAFREMTEKIWLRDWQPPRKHWTENIPDFHWAQERESEHALAAEEKTLAESQAPRSKRASKWDRLHLKLAGERPGLDEVRITKRMLRRKPQPCESTLRETLTEELAAVADLASGEEWDDACYGAIGVVERVMSDVKAFSSVTPTRAQQRVLYAAALCLYSDLTEKRIAEACKVTEKTLREWMRLLDRYEYALGTIGRF